MPNPEAPVTATPEQTKQLLDELSWLQAKCRRLSPQYGEDIAQMTIIKFLTNAHTIKTPNGKIRGWLATAARNTTIDLCRSKQMQTYPLETSDIEELMNNDAKSNPPLDAVLEEERNAELAERDAKLAELMDTLPPRQRQILIDIYFEERKYEELIEEYGDISRNALARLASYARAKLRASM